VSFFDETPPFPAFVVDVARRMTYPWRNWVTRLLEEARGSSETITTIRTILSQAAVSSLYAVEVDLGGVLRRSGAVELELPGAGELTGPVLVTQGPGPRPDEAQVVQVVGVAELRGGRRLRVHWLAVGDRARGRVVFHVLTGGV